MSVKVVRMQNGEDVITDVKEIRPEEGKSAIAYEFLDAFTVTILRPTEDMFRDCLLYTSPSPRDRTRSRMPSSA